MTTPTLAAAALAMLQAMGNHLPGTGKMVEPAPRAADEEVG